MEETRIKIDGMSCQGCVKNVTATLLGIAGVSSAEVSLEAGEARVSFESASVSRQALVSAIEDAGFEAK